VTKTLVGNLPLDARLSILSGNDVPDGERRVMASGDDHESASTTDDPEFPLDSKDPATRTSLGCASVFLGAIAAWMFWFVHHILNGREWGEFFLRTLLDELAFSIVLFAAVGVVWALFTPEWLRRWLHAATEKIVLAPIVLLAVLFGGLVVVWLIALILSQFGIRL